ncbi:unnamed protein product, partial [marine sediment metagenome]
EGIVARRQRRPGKMSTPEAATIEVGYQALTREAFAVWIRLMVEPENVLESAGLARLAERFNYRERAFKEILRQLRNKGYVRIESPPRPGVPAKLFIQRRVLLVGRDHFIRLS